MAQGTIRGMMWLACACVLASLVVSGCGRGTETTEADMGETTPQGELRGYDSRDAGTIVLPADVAGVLIEVTDRAGLIRGRTGDDASVVYLARSTHGWDPAGLEHHTIWMRGPTEGGTEGWGFLLTRGEIERHAEVEFKFTRGDWSTAEVATDGNDIPNRTLSDVPWDALERRDVLGRPALVLPLAVEGFADQRGTRWPMDERMAFERSGSRRSTVVGTLELHVLSTPTLTTPTRTIRVWLPEGYHDPANAERRYPVLYMHDGQNLFDAATSAFGSEWRVDETMTVLIAEGAIEPWIVVGIDHAGEHRVGELSPDGVEVRGQTGSGSKYVAFVVDELVPWIEREYRAIPEPVRRAMGGSSCGGNITVQTVLERPGVFERVLIESPALWIGDEVLTERAKRFDGALPTRVFIGMGDAEYGDAERDAALVEMARSLRDAMKRPMPRDGAGALGTAGYPFVALQIAEGAKHNEDAWAERLPAAMVLLLGE